MLTIRFIMADELSGRKSVLEKDDIENKFPGQRGRIEPSIGPGQMNRHLNPVSLRGGCQREQRRQNRSDRRLVSAPYSYQPLNIVQSTPPGHQDQHRTTGLSLEQGRPADFGGELPSLFNAHHCGVASPMISEAMSGSEFSQESHLRVAQPISLLGIDQTSLSSHTGPKLWVKVQTVENYYYCYQTHETTWSKPLNVKIITQEELDAMTSEGIALDANIPDSVVHNVSSGTMTPMNWGNLFLLSLPLQRKVAKAIGLCLPHIEEFEDFVQYIKKHRKLRKNPYYKKPGLAESTLPYSKSILRYVLSDKDVDILCETQISREMEERIKNLRVLQNQLFHPGEYDTFEVLNLEELLSDEMQSYTFRKVLDAYELFVGEEYRIVVATFRPIMAPYLKEMQNQIKLCNLDVSQVLRTPWYVKRV